MAAEGNPFTLLMGRLVDPHRGVKYHQPAQEQGALSLASWVRSGPGSGGPKPDSQGSMTAKPTVKSNRQIGCSSQFAPARTTFTRL